MDLGRGPQAAAWRTSAFTATFICLTRDRGARPGERRRERRVRSDVRGRRPARPREPAAAGSRSRSGCTRPRARTRSARSPREPRPGGEATTSRRSSRPSSGSRSAPAATSCSAPTRWAPAGWARTRQTSVAGPVGRAARHEGRLDRRRQRLPDLVRDQPDGLDHGARPPDGRRRSPRTPAPRAPRQPTQAASAGLDNFDEKEPTWLPRPRHPSSTGHPSEPIVRDRLYIGGEWVEPAGSGTIEVVDSTTEQVIGRIPEGRRRGRRPRRRRRARTGFEAWSRGPGRAAARGLPRDLSAALAARADEIAVADRRRGRDAACAVADDPGRAAGDGLRRNGPGRRARSLGGAGRQLAGRARAGRRGRLHHAVELPAAPDLREGRAGARRRLLGRRRSRARSRRSAPSSSPRSSTRSELPAGVFNLVTGYGPVVGEAIAAHPDVDMVSFTGSTRAGRRVAEVAAGNVKRVALELGGKSANVILDDADLQAAVAYGVANCYLNSGQTCSAHTRMLVPREKLAEAEAIARAAAEKATPGDPFDDGTPARAARLRRAARARPRATSSKGEEEGAKLVAGGAEPPEGLEQRLLRPPDGLLRGEARDDDRAGGDLRAGALDHPLRRRGRGGRDRQLRRSTGWTAASGRPTPSGRRRSRGGCAPARCRSTARPSTRWRPFGGLQAVGPRPRATAASASRSSSRSSRSSCSCLTSFARAAHG